MPTTVSLRALNLKLIAAVALAALVLAPDVSAWGDEAKRQSSAEFLQRYCFDCHSGDSADGGLNLQTLGDNLADEGLFARWEQAYDRVQLSEMPPASAEQPTADERARFLASLGDRLTEAHRQRKGTVLRRLNRREYENTLNDLFGTNVKLADRLPQDGRSHEFDNVGASLGISAVQMQRYLESVEAVLDAAIARHVEPPPSKIVRASYADTRGAEEWLGKIWLKRDDGAVVFFKQFGYPSGMLREANTEKDGWYKVRVTGYAFQSEEPITFSIGATTFAPGAEQPTFGYFSMPPGAPTTVELRVWIPARYMISVEPYGLFDRNEIRKSGLASYRGPGLAIQSVEVEGPLTDEFPSRGHRLLFDGLERAEIMPRNPADRLRSYYVPKFEIRTQNATADVRPVLARVATRAFRRPVTDEQVQPYVDLFAAELQRGEAFEPALRTAVTAIFCSPDFLFFRERPKEAPGGTAAEAGDSFVLDDYSLATRLSYFLRRSAPDDELLAAAAAGKLTGDPHALAKQAERLLQSPTVDRFIVDFTDAWLNLREIEFTNPDEVLYPEFDRFLQFSMLDETRAYVRKLIEENWGVDALVRSDFAMLNSRLAQHYGIEGVAGPEIRQVKLPTGSVRGGLLSQASVLKVSANGTNTSPVVRGVWVMERILGQTPSPPPPGIPGVEPDIRGATTLREQLDKHRNVENCRGCHQKIDPPGFALESFDPIGGWRERFRSIGQGESVKLEIGDRKVRYKLGPPVDASGELPSGEKFSGFVEFRDLLAENRPALARALVTKFLTFGTGREMGFSDRPEIERIVQAAAADDYGVRTLLLEAIGSEIFRRK